MEIKNLKNISVSNLILIILNDKNNDILRKCAEIELKKRIKNVGWKYDDLLHFDDKVIKKRGLDIENYLISQNVNMQQLMETYFLFNYNTDYNSNNLLFSEKHLCNELDFGEPFFHKICNKEIKNIDKRIKKLNNDSQKQILILIKQILLERGIKSRTAKIDCLKEDSIELFCINDAME